MLLKMNFRFLVGGRWRRRRSNRYEKLHSINEKAVAGPRPRPRWMAKMNGKLKGFRLPRSRKLNWKAISGVTFPTAIARIYYDIVRRTKMEDICSGVTFSGQWGLPVLSHSSVERTIPLHRD
ncbi:hypothetical protein Vadar_032045 [Vaccinium darrowii]|uniref:Uncharacterized protein n=1 Tax=Vaccinium darrowii TaxID=229202 RepID=A0ACB7ZMP6_9ERIC|nr:hypothetical protein Vadar_032045 [Vaccinium darrowii]